MRWYLSTRLRLGLTLVCSTLICVGLFVIGAIRNHSRDFDYMIWNLFLAWVPLGVMLYLERTLRRKLWSSWHALLVTLLFIGFLPNAFYVTTDVIHIQEIPRVDIVFDAVMLEAFILNAFLLGLISVHLFHNELRKRLSPRISWMVVEATLLITSFAIYIGRDLRWNTWDVILNPASILFEVSDRFLHIASHPEVFSTTFSFFALTTSLYVSVRLAGRLMRQQKQLD
jgi:uncharacterized membrane protein